MNIEKLKRAIEIASLLDGSGEMENGAVGLISAAPDLLEALQQLVIEYDEVDLADAEPASLTAAVIAARVAIAKAERKA